MGAIILNISIPQEQKAFLDENPHFSPSKIFQSRIVELMEEAKGWRAEIERLRGALVRHSERILNANNEIDELKKQLLEKKT